MASPLIGQVFGHYRILDQLGAGGMGVVYRAQDQRLGRLVALKVLPTATAQDEEAIERFRREARTASSLSHPNICTIFSFDEIDGQLVLAMELLDGETLDRRLAARALDLRTLLDTAEQIADALDAAHSEGILHRDIKPANIFITRRGQVKVLDFGLAKLARDYRGGDRRGETFAADQFTSIAGTTVGTIAYMSPEQARGEDLDPRTDLFSFGVVLYEMATGRQGFPGNTTAVIFDGILNREPAAPSTVNSWVPHELDRIIGKSLEKDRAMRYQTAADMRSDLRRLRRDSSSRRIVAADVDPNAATVVLPPTGQSTVATDVSQPHEPVGTPTVAATAPLPPPSAAPASTASSATAAPSKAVLALAAVAIVAILTAIVLFLSRSEQAPASAAAIGEPAAPPVETSSPSDLAPSTAAAQPSSAAAVPAAAEVNVPTKTTPGAGAGAGALPPGDPSLAGASTRPAAAAGKGTTPDAKPGATREESAASERLSIAKAKLASNLREQAVADLRQIVVDYSPSPVAAEAGLMAAEELEKMGRLDDAMAAHVEFTNRFPNDPRLAQSRLRLAGLTLKSRRPNREAAAREMYGNVARDYPKTPSALEALQRKLQLESSTRQKERDPLLGVDAPVAVPTLRMLVEQFPDAPGTMLALNRLADLYMDMDQYVRAANVLTDLATRFPSNPHDAWFRLGELYERQLRDPERARAAYAQVPSTSSKYRDAQRRANKK